MDIIYSTVRGVAVEHHDKEGVIMVLDFDEKLKEVETPDELKKLKTWMFQEQVRIQARKDELEELRHELQRERTALENERNALDKKIEAEKKRFQDNEIFMKKKLKIIEDGYQQLSVDKKMLECERLNFEYEKVKFRKQKASTPPPPKVYPIDTSGAEIGFFKGVDNQLALRKRYKELLKIYHPDNRCGDAKTLMRIQAEYDGLKRQYYEV